MNSEELKEWRGALGLSQRAAAQALGITLATYQALERGISFQAGKPVSIDRRTEYACKYISEHPETLI